MGAYKAYPNGAVVIIDFDNKAVGIAFDVKYHPVIRQYACAWIFRLDFIRGMPLAPLCFLIPCLQRLLAVRESEPKFTKINKSSRFGKYYKDLSFIHLP